MGEHSGEVKHPTLTNARESSVPTPGEVDRRECGVRTVKNSNSGNDRSIPNAFVDVVLGTTTKPPRAADGHGSAGEEHHTVVGGGGRGLAAGGGDPGLSDSGYMCAGRADETMTWGAVAVAGADIAA